MELRTLAVALALLVTVPSVARPQDSAAAASRGPNYVIGAHDALRITSYDDEDLTGRHVVDADGTFAYPLLGRVKVGGMTVRAAEASLKRTLVERGLFRNPQITIAIDEYRSQKVFVIGEVRPSTCSARSGRRDRTRCRTRT